MSIKGVAVTLCTLVMLVLVIRELRREVMIVAPFDVPKSFTDMGLTGAVLANRVGVEIEQVEAQSHSAMKNDRLVSRDDSSSSPDIQIPGTKFSLQVVVGLLRQVLHITPGQIEGSVALRQVLSADSGSSVAHLEVVVYVTRGEGPKKESDFQLDSTDPDSLVVKTSQAILRMINPYLYACYSFDHLDYATADSVLRGVTQDPRTDQLHQAAAHNLLGLIERAKGHKLEAIAEYKRAISTVPAYSPPYNNLANVFFDDAKFDDALALYKKALDLDHHSSNSYIGWAKILAKKEQYEEAVSKFKQAIAVEPDRAIAYIAWGQMLASQKESDLALAKFEEATRADSKDPEAFLALGNQLHAMRRNDEAIADYKIAASITPTGSAYIGWAEAVTDYRTVTLDQYKLADSLFEKAVELDKESPAPLIAWGASLQQRRRFAESVNTLKRAVDRAPQDPALRVLVGDALLLDKQFSAAALYYRKAIELKPQSDEGYTALGHLFLDQNNTEEAVRNFEKALAVNGRSADALFFWGVALQKQGQLEASLEKLSRAVEVQPDYARAYYLRSNIYFAQRRYTDGMSNFKKAAELSPELADAPQPLLDAHIYDQSMDAKLQIKRAVAEARRLHKRVILNFGANWCGDCQVLHLYLSDPTNKRILESDFVVVPISYERESPNTALAQAYGVPAKSGIPVLAVLDTNGDLLFVQENGDFADMRREDISDVTQFLKRWQLSK